MVRLRSKPTGTHTVTQENLQISLIQSEVKWHDSAANLASFAEQIARLENPGHLIMLPETFASGFTQEPAKAAEAMDGPAVNFMREQSRLTGAAITGSLAIADRGHYFNRMLFVADGEVLGSYDKKHLFTLAGEHKRYAAGSERVVVDYLGWRICLQVCYDLRFPVFSRCRNDYDLLLYVANWPMPRAHAWSTLLRGRAIENLCYTVGVNRTGLDGNNWEYAGGSAAVDYLGHDLVDLGTEPRCATVTLSLADQNAFRDKFRFLDDADDFVLLDGERQEKTALRGAG